MDNIAVARGRYLKFSPRKGKLMVDLIRNKNVGEAITILKFSRKKKASAILKLLNSAVANAQVKFPNLDVDGLYVSEIYCNKGQYQKRFRPRARGRASRILKRSSHVTIFLKEREA